MKHPILISLILLAQFRIFRQQLEQRLVKARLLLFLISFLLRRSASASDLNRNYFWNRCQNIYTPRKFFRTFRMTREVFETLCMDLDIPVSHSSKKFWGREKIDKRMMVAIFLYRLAHKCTLFQISETWGVSESSVVRITRTVADAILFQLGSREIYFPSKSNLINQALEFSRRTGFPNAVGAIDGTHIKIKRPNTDWEQYFTRKKEYAIQCQAIVDTNGLFVDCITGYTGAAADARVFALSPISSKGSSYIPTDHFILGDSAYPNKSWLLVPFKHYRSNPLTEAQKLYNLLLAKARVIIEHAFGRLKQRWRLLRYMDMGDFKLMHKLIICAVILHNYCERRNDCLSEREIKKVKRRVAREIEEQLREQTENIQPVFEHEFGTEIRNRIVAKISNEFDPTLLMHYDSSIA